MPPAFEKRLLQGIAGVFQIADQANERAEKLSLGAREQGAERSQFNWLAGRRTRLLGVDLHRLS